MAQYTKAEQKFLRELEARFMSGKRVFNPDNENWYLQFGFTKQNFRPTLAVFQERELIKLSEKFEIHQPPAFSILERVVLEAREVTFEEELRAEAEQRLKDDRDYRAKQDVDAEKRFQEQMALQRKQGNRELIGTVVIVSAVSLIGSLIQAGHILPQKNKSAEPTPTQIIVLPP